MLEKISLLLNCHQKDDFEIDTTRKEILNVIKSISNNKSLR